MRGNVGTRLNKLDRGEYDALLLASAGLKRLGLGTRINECLSVSDSLPAPGQGALGIECRAQDKELIALLDVLADLPCATTVGAERAVSAGLGADCSAPLGAYAEMKANGIELKAVLASLDGTVVLRATAVGDDPVRLGRRVAEQLLVQGGERILASSRTATRPRACKSR